MTTAVRRTVGEVAVTTMMTTTREVEATAAEAEAIRPATPRPRPSTTRVTLDHPGVGPVSLVPTGSTPTLDLTGTPGPVNPHDAPAPGVTTVLTTSSVSVVRPPASPSTRRVDP